MAILFDRVPASELGTKYTHFGYLHGFVPVYIGEVDNEADGPLIAVRNNWPDWLEDVGCWMWLCGDFISHLLGFPGSDGWMMEVAGEITPPNEVHP